MNNPNKVIMIRPANFGYNSETAPSNRFQINKMNENIQETAQKEFDGMVEKLKTENIDIIVFEDNHSPIKPDAIFPNNWISTHPDKSLVIYPMEAKNRRLERRDDVIHYLTNNGYTNNIIDYTQYENENLFLEGTGSIIFDAVNKLAYACISSRTNEHLLNKLCKQLNYSPIVFVAEDIHNTPIYHTNVMLSIGDSIVVICSESITNHLERAMVLQSLRNTKKTIIEVSFAQMNSFACNCLEVVDTNNQSKLILSTTAYTSLTISQRIQIEQTTQFVAVEIPTIEQVGGGSARCMLLGVV
jgi:hypothetical protein